MKYLAILAILLLAVAIIQYVRTGNMKAVGDEWRRMRATGIKHHEASGCDYAADDVARSNRLLT